MLAALLAENDLAALKYLKELNVEDHDDVKSGFKISLVRIVFGQLIFLLFRRCLWYMNDAE